MDSVISQQQLGMLLGTMKNSVPVNKILQSLENTYKFSALEKSAFYHGILDILKTSDDSRKAAISIVETIDCLLRDKANGVAEEMDICVNGGESPGATGPSKASPIFRRVG